MAKKEKVKFVRTVGGKGRFGLWMEKPLPERYDKLFPVIYYTPKPAKEPKPAKPIRYRKNGKPKFDGLEKFLISVPVALVTGIGVASTLNL